MKFEILDEKMRQLESLFDQYVLPYNYIIVRLDGKGFTKLTKETLDYKKPFDDRFHDAMVETSYFLLHQGFKVLYAYTQSDEISLLIEKNDQTYKRKVRKINSLLSGAASGFFSLKINEIGIFDARVIPIPNLELVLDYFSWRQEDAHRNSLSSYCYWVLRDQGKDYKEATQALLGLSTSQKNELLFQYSINYNNLPEWQRRGTALYRPPNKIGDLKSQQTHTSIMIDEHLLTGDAYRSLLQNIVLNSGVVS